MTGIPVICLVSVIKVLLAMVRVTDRMVNQPHRLGVLRVDLRVLLVRVMVTTVVAERMMDRLGCLRVLSVQVVVMTVMVVSMVVQVPIAA